MPIPKYNSGQIQERGYSNSQLSTNAPIEAFGGGAQKAIGEAQKFILQEKENADQLVTTEVYAQLKQKKNDLIFNPETGLMNRKGKDAFGAPDEYLPQFDKSVEEITKGLSQSQQEKVRKLVLSERLDLDESINKHMSRERVVYDDEVTKTGIIASQDDAVRNYKDYNKVLSSLDEQHALVEAQARRNGLGDDWVKAQMSQLSSKTHTGVMSRMLADGDDLAASKYYQANKDFFTGADATRITKELEEGSLRGTSQRISDGIVSKAGSLSVAIGEVKKIEDPKVRDATMERVKSEFTMRDAVKRDREEQLFLKATNILEKGGGYDSIPPGDIAQMPLSQRSALRSYMSSKESDATTYYNLKTMAATPELRDKFLQTNLMEYAGKLSKADFKDLVTDQAALRKGDGKTEAKLDGFLGDKSVVDQVAQSAGFLPGRFASDSEKTKYNAFLAAVNKEQIAHQKRTGKPASSEEVRGIADQLVIKGTTDKGFIFDTKKMLFEATDKEEFDIGIEDIPKAEIKRIQDVLKSRNMPDSDTSILSLYKAKLKGMRSGK